MKIGLSADNVVACVRGAVSIAISRTELTCSFCEIASKTASQGARMPHVSGLVSAFVSGVDFVGLVHLRCPFLQTSQLWVRLIAFTVCGFWLGAVRLIVFACCGGWFGPVPVRSGMSDVSAMVWCTLGRLGALMMYGRMDFFASDAMVGVGRFVEEVVIVVLIPTSKCEFSTRRPWPKSGVPAVFGLPAAAAAWADRKGISIGCVWGARVTTTDAEERVRCSLYNIMVWLCIARRKVQT